ncbi:MAG: PQQ-like beta-propeller repeat protein [Lachnospiraceae bacterium]|nr:PQQ-like beta-propeller repeat protein [Lachnospiraceae bacterium]
MLKKRRIQMTIIAVVFCLTFAASEVPEASGQTGEMSDLFYQYIGEVLIPEYGLSGSGQTTQMSACEEYSGQWLQSGILSAAVTDLDGDGKEECLVFLLEDEAEEGLDLYALVYEEEDGEVQLSDSRYLDSVYQSDWWKCGWNISLIENEDSSSYILFEDCTWGNTWYALEISMSASYLVEEEYEIFGYDGTSFEDIYSYVQGGAASGGFEYEEYVYENGSLVSERTLYSSIPSDVYTDSGSGSVFGSYTEAMNYVAGLYGLTVNTDLISDSDTNRLWPQMSESIFLDSENLTRVFRYAILTEDTESPYTYEQILVDYTDQEWSSCYQGAGGSDADGEEENTGLIESAGSEEVSASEEALQAKLNELISTYGIFESGLRGTVMNYDIPYWLQTSGILSAEILDLDADGTQELLVCRTDDWMFNGDSYYKILTEVYELENETVILSDSMWFEPYGFSKNDETSFTHQYVSLIWKESSQVYATIHFVQVESGYYLVCEYYDQGVLADGGYAATWVLEYRNGALQYVCSLENGEVGSSVETGFAYEFEDGVNTKTTMYYDPEWCDLGYWEGSYTDLQEWNGTSSTIKTEFFSKYGLTFSPVEMELDIAYDLFDDDDYYGFTGTTSGDSETELVFRLLVDYVVEDDDYELFLLEETLTRGNELLGEDSSDMADDPDYYFIFVEGELDSDQTYVFADIYAYDAEGEYLWEYETGAYEPTELSRVYEIGQRNDCYYYVEGGTVVALEAETGEILWENSEFGGSGKSAFSDAGICLTGFYGPDFFAVSYDGTTLCEIDSFGTEYYWASYIEIVDNTALVTLNEGEHEAQVNLDTWEYTINY